MKYIQTDQKITKLKLTRDITKHIKRGNPWVFSDAVEKIKAPEGALTQLIDRNGDVVASGFYSPSINLCFRVVTIGKQKISDHLIEERLTQAINNKRHLYHEKNQCLRVLNGEGDELPGIVADLYHKTLVLKLDGVSSEKFWNKEALADFFMSQSILPIECVYFKRKNNEAEKGEILRGETKDLTHQQFLENGVLFESNIIDAAKTGFFLDQRENRDFIRSVSKGKTLLNLFGYTGGFSVYAGLGGATKVTTVDIAPGAIEASQTNWKLNHLPATHEAICEDAFSWLIEAQQKKQTWDIVITDPPSFAPNQKAVSSAKDAYIKVFSDSLKLVKDGGFFAASSCSGHIGFDSFLEIVQEALSKTRRRGKILLIKGQPEDHPFPLALPEMRYLKFVYLQVFN